MIEPAAIREARARKSLATALTDLRDLGLVDPGRGLSLAITNLEQAEMWLEKHCEEIPV
jgi:hypothetical protein